MMRRARARKRTNSRSGGAVRYSGPGEAMPVGEIAERLVPCPDYRALRKSRQRGRHPLPEARAPWAQKRAPWISLRAVMAIRVHRISKRRR
jgi:hypothetical protein